MLPVEANVPEAAADAGAAARETDSQGQRGQRNNTQ
jgi:hypothetical protein